MPTRRSCLVCEAPTGPTGRRTCSDECSHKRQEQNLALLRTPEMREQRRQATVAWHEGRTFLCVQCGARAPLRAAGKQRWCSLACREATLNDRRQLKPKGRCVIPRTDRRPLWGKRKAVGLRPNQPRWKLIWLLAGRTLPERAAVYMKCGNRRCVQIRHMWVGSKGDVILLHRSQSLTPLCKRGHPLIGENVHTYSHPKGYQMRICRMCRDVGGMRADFAARLPSEWIEDIIGKVEREGVPVEAARALLIELARGFKAMLGGHNG